VADLKARYEFELAQASEKSKEMIEAAHHEVQRSRETLDATVRQSYEEQFALVPQQFDVAKANLESQSKTLIDSANTQLATVRSELDELKKRADAQLSEFQSTQNELLKLPTGTLAAVEERHKRAVQKHVTTANKKYISIVLSAAKR
jgi:hypothetical protein